MVRAGTPKKICQRLSDELVKVAQTPEFATSNSGQDSLPVIGNQDQFQAEAAGEYPSRKRVEQVHKSH